ncbi:hypothetical protein D917_05757 [Trichinella nativa]|uniref:Uncharacterized protein n=1 Tax=Trichinella nativa TaxID=6335 RepID=A0A1Y3EZ34_9BILA|nr:hypothetical protein D917_05757 [Trichinella nativa]
MVSDWVTQFSLQLLPLSRDFESCNLPYQLGHGRSVRIRKPCQSQPPFLCPRAALVRKNV